ncbi:MAG: hypothetical protein QW165_02800 [Candidatus Woesearchaeota archaeon]
MKVVRHTAMHVFVHVALFTACALLIPVVSSAFDGTSEWKESHATITASVLLIIVCVYLMYKLKESVPDVLRSFGGMIFLPGALNVLLSMVNFESFFSSAQNVTGMAFVAPAVKFYIEHSVPTIMTVAAVYMAIGGTLYWTGHIIDKVKDKFSWSDNS